MASRWEGVSGERKKTNKHKEFWRDTPWCVSRLSRASVPSYVPSAGCPWDVPNLSLGRFRGIPTAKFLYVIFLYRFFLSLSQAPPSFWKVPGLPRKFPKLPRKFFGDFTGSSLTVELNSNPGVPRKFPRLPRKFPGLPRKFCGLPQRQPLSLGSLTPSPDSQELSLIN